jgi:cytochrome c-type biogenesis protein CcmH/NrfG
LQQTIRECAGGADAHGATQGAKSAAIVTKTARRTRSISDHLTKIRTTPDAAGCRPPAAAVPEIRQARRRAREFPAEPGWHPRCNHPRQGGTADSMAGRHRDSITPLTAVTGIAGVLFGVIVGYMLGVSRTGARSLPVAAVQTTAAPAPALADEQELQGWRNILASDPKNVRANVELANRLYDARRYAEAVPYYQQAFTVDPKNVGVSTDLATALYYSGRADEALAQFDKSLTLDPKHGQTLFNIGIVKRDARNDPKGAIAAWERLLASVPDYPDAAKVRTMIAELKTRVS